MAKMKDMMHAKMQRVVVLAGTAALCLWADAGTWRKCKWEGNPVLGTWDASATYKPSVVRDERNGRWLLWYNGRNGGPEYVGCAVHDGLDLNAAGSCAAA